MSHSSMRIKVMSILTFQVVFTICQIFIFYSCLLGSAEVRLDRDALDKSHPGTQNGMTADAVMQEDAPGKYKPTWASLETRPIPEWFDEARIGIFIHWGVFSVPGFVGVGTKGLAEWFWWYWKVQQVEPLPDPEQNEKLQGAIEHRKEAIESVQTFMKNNYPPTWKYTDFASQFTAEFFEPEKWAEIFKASGAKYVVLTSKHHDGFTLWGSRKSWNWNSVDVGPRRDLVGDLGKAVRDAGLHYGLYHSLYEWFNPIYNEDRRSNFTTQNFLREKVTPELMDLVTKYKPDVLWSDGHFEAPSSYWNSTQFLAWLFNESPVKDHVVTNDRWGTDANCKYGSFLDCDDRYNPGKKMPKKWENCFTLDHESWGYRRNAKLIDYYDMDQLTELLAQTISYGGNLLMNIGPTPDGRIAPIYEERLRQFGAWLGVNGEAIYTTEVWHTPQDPGNDAVYYTKEKGSPDTIYAILLEWPKDDLLRLTAPKLSPSTQVIWLGYHGDELTFHSEESGVVIKLPKISLSEVPCQYAWVFRMTGVQ